MKTRQLLPFAAGLILAAGFAPRGAAAPKPADQVTVTFEAPDKFTDVRENQSTITSTIYLDQLRDYLVETAAPLLAAGQKLHVAFTNIDLAGENLFNSPDNIRVMKEIYMPRMQVRFQLLGADGKVVKEGERKLVDQDYMMRIGIPGADRPLYYDKEMLKRWIQEEFKAKG